MLPVNLSLAVCFCFAVVSAARAPVKRGLDKPTCAQDNCYNAFTHSLTIATPFCRTYIQLTSTSIYTPTYTLLDGVLATTPLPSFTPIPPQTTNLQLSSRCNLDTNAAGVLKTSLSLRLSSACTCIGVVPRLVTTTITAPATTTTITSGPVLCPNLPNNGLYQIYCDKVLNHFVSSELAADITFDATFNLAGCLAACSLNQDCYTVNYVFDQGSYSCGLYKNINRSEYDISPGGAFALKVGGN